MSRVRASRFFYTSKLITGYREYNVSMSHKIKQFDLLITRAIRHKMESNCRSINLSIYSDFLPSIHFYLA